MSCCMPLCTTEEPNSMANRHRVTVVDHKATYLASGAGGRDSSRGWTCVEFNILGNTKPSQQCQVGKKSPTKTAVLRLWCAIVFWPDCVGLSSSQAVVVGERAVAVQSGFKALFKSRALFFSFTDQTLTPLDSSRNRHLLKGIAWLWKAALIL